MLPVPRRPSSDGAPPPVLVFDFDGVLCDSLEECMLVAWYARVGAPVGAFVDPGLAGVPLEVVARFKSCRPFMRHVLHLLVPIVEPDPPRTRAAFAARFDAIPADEAEAFGEAVDGYRAALRRDHPQRWCERHGIERRLEAIVRGAYVATARDSASVSHILRAHGMAVHDDHVFGSLRTKPPALDAIAARERRPRADVVLVDDSIENCIAAREEGFGAHWASWGYHAPEDAETARTCGIPAVTVEALLKLEPREPAVRS